MSFTLSAMTKPSGQRYWDVRADAWTPFISIWRPIQHRVGALRCIEMVQSHFSHQYGGPLDAKATSFSIEAMCSGAAMF